MTSVVLKTGIDVEIVKRDELISVVTVVVKKVDKTILVVDNRDVVSK